MSLFAIAYSYTHSVYDLTDTIASFSILNMFWLMCHSIYLKYYGILKCTPRLQVYTVHTSCGKFQTLPGTLFIQIWSIMQNIIIITILHLSN
jgi:hypothetical protein